MESQKKKKPSQSDEPRPLTDHLEELRRRLIYSLAAVVICAFAAHPAVDRVIADLSRMVRVYPGAQLIFVSPVEAVWSRIKIAVFLGIMLSLPFVLFQVLSFIQRGLLPKEKRFIFPLTLMSFLLFSAGAAFCYFFILPAGIRFLLSYGSEVLVPMISISRYLSFVFGLIFSFGLIFELPLAVGFLTKLGILRSAVLRRQRRTALVAVFILAAALTPGPDVFSQFLMAVPLLLLYEISIGVARLIEKKAGLPHNKKSSRAAN